MDESLELLMSLGFSKNEATLYNHLLSSPEGRTLEEIVADGGIPSSEAQTAIQKLVEKHALKVFSNRFEAIAPKQLLDQIFRRKELEAQEKLNEIHQTISTLTNALEPLYWEKKLGIRPAEILEPLESLRDMELRTAQIVGNAEKSIVIFAETFGWYDKVREVLLRVLDRQVHTRVLMLILDKDSTKRAMDLRQLGVEVRHCVEEWYPVRGTLSDNTELVFLIWATRKKGVQRPIHYRPHYTTNIGLIKVFTDAFEKRWEEAKTI